MTDTEQRAAAQAFAAFWKGKGYEKGESQTFWLMLLEKVLGVADPAAFIAFESEAKLDHASFIDGFIASTHVLIEQKSLDKDLKKPIKQSDGSLLTPFQQALRYAATLPYSQRPRWIVTCNFASFLVYDMENPNAEPEEILLKDLAKESYRLRFLVDSGDDKIKKEMEVSIAAGELVGILYDALLKQYHDPESPATQRSLNMLCVRLVFCLYAEDAGIFGGPTHSKFHDFLARYPAADLRHELLRLFKILDTKTADRDPYLDPGLAAFPYVNGGLFADESVVVPQFTDEIRALLLDKASAGFDWSDISPTIFGAVFESTLNPETRRAGGMHYTSIENIHKVIDPLFLDGLRAELAAAKAPPVEKTRQKALEAFQTKLASLTFLDPACGSGNFLTETYLSLRRLENDALRTLFKGQGQLGLGDVNPIKVTIGQFYGIEINDFAVTVARTALWIAESQMMKETEDIIHADLAFLPLKAYPNIVEGNALRTDWAAVVPPVKLNYIMGNPPFVGFTFQSAEQKKDMTAIFPGTKNLDFVCAWFKKASDFIQGTDIHCGFVATNSVTQGETVASFWKFLAIRINYAYRTFIWNNEAKQKAHVHCVIIGFSAKGRASSPCEPPRIIFDEGGRPHPAANINAYLIDAPNLIVTSRQKPLCNVPPMVYGNKPADGGNLIIEDADYPAFIAKEPQAKKFIRPLLGAEEYLHGKKRWVLWLKGASPAELQKCPLVLDRIAKCKEMREHSIAAAIRKFALTPTLFAQITQPEGKDYIIVPEVSSESRRYIPMAFLPSSIICTNLVKIIPDATLYHFGILESNVHMAWMRVVCGRLEMRYRYSKDVVYNNFPWPTPTAEQRGKIEATAQGILDARKKYPTSSLADLYDPLTMPPELIAAHQANDRAVMAAYGFPVKDFTESACVAALMRLYESAAKSAVK